MSLLFLVSDNKFVILFIINFILFFVGVFMDMILVVLIFILIFFLVVIEFGMDFMYFGIVMVFNLCIGLCIFLVGLVFFVGVGVVGISI